MHLPILRLLLTSAACVALALPAVAQDKTLAGKAASSPRILAAAQDKTAKRNTLKASLGQTIDTALIGEDKLKAAMAADMAAIRAAKTPEARMTLARAYRAKYQRDSQRILGRANLNIQALSGQMRAIDPGATFKVAGGTATGEQTVTAQSQPASSPPPSIDTVRNLAGNDFRVDIDSDCGPGWGETTQSGGYMKSESEGCVTSGRIYHILEVPAGKTVRVEMTASFTGEAHVINNYAEANAGIRIVNDRDDEIIARDGFAIYAGALLVGDDVSKTMRDVRLVRDLGPGRYRIEGSTESYAPGMIAGWSVAEARLQAMRVKLTTSPRQ